MIWHNFDDGNLNPYVAINYYKRVAVLHVGYAKLQKNVRLSMPSMTHCRSTGPNAIDAPGAMEAWVERGQAPEVLPATVTDRQFSPGAPKAEVLRYANCTDKLCKFPKLSGKRQVATRATGRQGHLNAQLAGQDG